MKHFIEEGQTLKTNSYGDITVLKKLERGHFLVEFSDTGYRVTAHRGNILAGKVRDRSKKNALEHDWENCNIPMENNSGDRFSIISRKADKCIVRFESTGYTTEAYFANVSSGKVRDPYKPSYHGVGYDGEWEKVHYWKRAKQLWTNMIKRCYDQNDPKGYYGRCFVDIHWHCFGNFLRDLPKLENFEGWLNFDKTGIKYNLDKDLRIPGNNVYSKAACYFELESLNKGATSRNNYYRG